MSFFSALGSALGVNQANVGNIVGQVITNAVNIQPKPTVVSSGAPASNVSNSYNVGSGASGFDVSTIFEGGTGLLVLGVLLYLFFRR